MRTYLERARITTFYPEIRYVRRTSTGTATHVGPLFPGYVFAKCDLRLHFRTLAYCRGVKELVTFGNSPACVDQELIEAIRSRISNGYVRQEPSAFRPGQPVRVQEGPLRGLEAVFQETLSDRQRVVLLLKALAYQARLVVSPRIVQGL